MSQDLYTLDDLGSRASLDAGHDKPARLAVIGYPVAHSLSPRMHQPARLGKRCDSRHTLTQPNAATTPARSSRFPGRAAD